MFAQNTNTVLIWVFVVIVLSYRDRTKYCAAKRINEEVSKERGDLTAGL
jgi:hypothetical protein